MFLTASCAAALFLSSGPSNSDAALEKDLAGIFAFFAQEETVITANRTATKLREVPSSVWVIDAQTIERMAATSLPDLLRLIPGIHTRELAPGNIDSHSRFPVFVPDNQTLVMIDNRPIQMDAYGLNDKMGIDIHDIERVEVLLGPASTLYGTGAYAGVINVITRKPVKDGVLLRGVLRSGVALGSNGDPAVPLNRPLPLGVGFAEGNYGWGKGGARLSLGGDYYPSFGNGTLAGGASFVVPARRITANADLVQETAGWTFRPRLSANLRHYAFMLFGSAPVDQQDYAASLNVTKPDLGWRGDELSILAWARHFRFDHTLNVPGHMPTPFSFSTISGELFAQYRTPRFYYNQLIAGVQIRYYDVDSVAIDPRARFQQFYGVFIEDNFRPLEQLILIAGARFETNENAVLPRFKRFNVSPRFGIVYLPHPNHSLRLELATAFRNPTPIESFTQLSTPDDVPLVVGRSAIPSEQLQQISFGYNGRIAWFSPRLEVFAARIVNLIYPEVVSAESERSEVAGIPLSPYLYRGTKLPYVVNTLEPIVLPGASVKLAIDPSPYFRAFVSYTLSPYQLIHQAALSMEGAYERFAASVQVYFQDQVVTLPADPTTVQYGGRVITNASLSYAIDQNWTVRASGTNLTDWRFFYTAPGVPRMSGDYVLGERLGPRVWLELRYTFKG